LLLPLRLRLLLLPRLRLLLLPRLLLSLLLLLAEGLVSWPVCSLARH
jgi:hypothetical protein